MVNLESLRERWKTIDALYHDNLRATLALQSEAALTLIPRVVEESQLGQAGLDRARAFIDDPVTVFRFFRKAHFDQVVALELLAKTLKWRLSTSIDLVSPSSLDPLYSENPLFYFQPNLHDNFGRYAAILNLANVVRPQDNTLDSFKEFIAFTLEVARRYLADMSKRDDANTHVQIVIILNLEGANFSNFEVEMLPFVVDLLKNHFPGMIGAIYVLNYGWTYAGMWQISKRVLPKAALERILFVSKTDLLTYFDKDNLLTDHGGDCTYKYRLSNNHILTKYGRPSYFLRYRLGTPSHSAAPSPAASRPLSRISSFESMRETFYSAPTTPKTLASRSPTTSHTNLQGYKQKHPNWLDMTMTMPPPGLATNPPVTHGNSLQLASPLPSPVRLSVPQSQPLSSASTSSDFRQSMESATLPQDLEEDYYQYESDSEISQNPDDNWDRESLSSDVTDDSGTIIAGKTRSSPSSPHDSARDSSLAQLRSQLEQHHVHQTPPLRSKSSGTLSPYNANNPFYGYTATRYLPGIPSSTVKLPQPRMYHARRRKRDLVRTLSYLFALRIFALHRKIKFRLSVIWKVIWAFLLRWGAVSRSWTRSSRPSQLDDEDDEDINGTSAKKKRKGVRWAVEDRPADTALSLLTLLNPFVLLASIPRWIIWLATMLLLRSRFFRRHARRLTNMVKAYLQDRLAG